MELNPKQMCTNQFASGAFVHGEKMTVDPVPAVIAVSIVDANGHAPPVGNTVDLTTGAYRNSIGAPTLAAVWTDPEFNPQTPAVYYARALEIPTARWTTLLALREKLPSPAAAPATIQERAWSSPIWFTPTGVGRRRGGVG